MFEQPFNGIDDILHKDTGCASELDYVGQTSLSGSGFTGWMDLQDE
jgi:hypothetical protein